MLLVLLLALSALQLRDAAGGHKKHVVPTFSHRVDWKNEHVDMLGKDFFWPGKFNFADLHSEDAFLRSSGPTVMVDKEVISDGDNVVVMWANIENPSEQDWIAVYCPPDGPLDDFLDYHFVNISSTWHKGEGFFQMKLFNMRQGYQFRYLRLVDGAHKVLASSRIVKCQYDEPQHGHLAPTEVDSEMRLTWTSAFPTIRGVYYGESLDFSKAKSVEDRLMSTSTYSASDMCGPPANTTRQIYFRNVGYIHSARMVNLMPDTHYYYWYFGQDQDHLPIVKNGSFHTAPLPGVTRRIRAAAFGDMGTLFDPYFWQNPGATLTATRLVEETEKGLDLVLHFGDISYAVGHGYLWEQFGWLMSSYATKVPVLFGVGNHEYDHLKPSPHGRDVSNVTGTGFHPFWGNQGDDSHGECGVPSAVRFPMPANGNKLFWYSHDYGLVHFVMISTEHNCSRGSEQYKWLEKDLASVDRSVFPWVILMTHRPMYADETTEEGDNIVALAEVVEFEHLLVKYKVNLMFSAHYHSYMRSCPIIEHKCQEPGKAPVHIVVGTAGAGLEKKSSTFPAKWIVANGIKFGYSLVTAEETNLRVDWMSSEHAGVVMDTVDIPLWKD